MQDKFEEFLEKRLPLPDVESVDEERLWLRISAEQSKKGRSSFVLFSIAASILFLMTAGISLFYLIQGPNTQSGLSTSKLNDPAVNREERVFRQFVSSKMAEVKQNSDRATYTEMMDQLDAIDAQLNTYLNDIHDVGDQPKILRGIIRCYEMKIRVIEKTLNEIEKTKNYENKKNIL